MLIEPRWVAHRELEYTLTKANELHGLKVVLASDWHFTKRPLWRVMTVARAQAIVAEINAAQPDVIVLAGDFIADSDYQPELAKTAEEEIAGVLSKLKARYGVYAVLGNHDWWFDGEKFTHALQSRGINVLENSATQVIGLDNLTIVGVGDDMTDHAQPNEALRQVPLDKPTIVAMHDPAALLKLTSGWRNPSALFLAGHTHGGQVYLPWIGALITPGRAPKDWAYGWHQYLDYKMYVTSGLGVSILPIRLNMRPEWVEFTLH